MKIITVAAAALNQTPMDWDGNLHRILKIIEEAKKQKVSILCFPEMSICGYGCEDTFLSLSLQKRCLELLNEVAKETTNIVVAVGLPINFENNLFNCAALLAEGQILGISAKRFLTNQGVHYESRWFQSWPENKHATIQIDGPVPIGDLIYEIDGVRIGFEICEDAWVAQRPGISLAALGVDIILNPSASHFSFGKHETRKSFVVDGSRTFAATYIYANLLGNEAGTIVYDGGSMISSAGKLIAEGPRFSFEETQLVLADIDLEKTRMLKHSHNNITNLNTLKLISFNKKIIKEKKSCNPVDEYFNAPMTKEEEFAKAVSLGLFDYLRKSRSKGFVLSLSGGADSASVAVLVSLMVEYACVELRVEGVKKILSNIELKGNTPKKITGEILTCVYQSTKNSGETTKKAAQKVALSLGAIFHIWDIDNLVKEYTQKVEDALMRKLNWTDDDIALQNIQARVRAPGIWMLANIQNALLLSTSNRSEAAVGYATMDGDTCGSLSPIAGIDKAFLLKWLKHLEIKGLPQVGTFPFLNAITILQPTAELRPMESDQTDEADLMPYTVLNQIEKLAIRDRKGPMEIFYLLSSQENESAETIKKWVIKFFQLFSKNQWKRQRYAPSFHLDDANLDPRSWCRFPILSGCFKTELEELKKENL